MKRVSPAAPSNFLGSRTTNNGAEYKGILMSLKLFDQKLVDLPDDRDPIEVRRECDSNLVVGQVAACKKKRLIPLFERAGPETSFLILELPP